jgi:hypothetical protein
MGRKALNYREKLNYLKTHLYPKLTLAAFGVVLIGLINCNQVNYTIKNIVYLRLTVNYPLVQLINGNVDFRNLKDTIHIYYHKNDVIYFIPYKETLETEQRIIFEKVKYKYFIYTKGDTSGLYSGSLSENASPRVLSVDSFLFNRAYAVKFDLHNIRLIGVSENQDNEVVEEKYMPTKADNENCYDTMVFRFDKRISNVEFSFSNEIEKIKMRKLVKVRLVFNQKYSQQYQIMMPQREMSFEIQKLPVKDPQYILSLFEQLRKQKKKYIG